MPKITFSHADKSVDAQEGDWLYDVAEESESGIPFSCKAGACGMCATEVLEGAENLGKQSAREIRTLSGKDADPTKYRLPCLCEVHGEAIFGKPLNASEEESSLGVHEVVVESYRPLNAIVAEVRFYVESEKFQFRPGQYVIFHIPHAKKVLRRSYSISTPPSDSRHFEVCVRSVAGGYGSNYVHRLRPGNRIEVEGPVGDFVLNESSDKDILMIATGTGISPIKSMLLHLLDTQSRRRVNLFFGVRHEADLFYTDLCRGLAARYPEFRFNMTLSAPNPQVWAGPCGRVTDLIERHFQTSGPENIEAYLCGGREMIEDGRKMLLDRGVDENAIFHENFY